MEKLYIVFLYLPGILRRPLWCESNWDFDYIWPIFMQYPKRESLFSLFLFSYHFPKNLFQARYFYQNDKWMKALRFKWMYESVRYIFDYILTQETDNLISDMAKNCKFVSIVGPRFSFLGLFGLPAVFLQKNFFRAVFVCYADIYTILLKHFLCKNL